MEETKKEEKVKQKNTGMAIVGLIIFFVPLLTDAKNDPFVKFYVKQGLVLFICWLIAGLATSVLMFVPGLGFLISQLAYLALVIILIIGIIAAANGEQKQLPLIGQFASQFKF